MKPRIGFVLFTSLIFLACVQKAADSQQQARAEKQEIEPVKKDFIDPEGKTISSRFLLPENYERPLLADDSFGQYLRQLPLKTHGAEVLYFDGRTKRNHSVYEAVVDLGIGKRDLHQCADAVMRLYAEHHYQQKQFEKIHFNFTNGFRVDYNEWRKGKRIVVKGNKSYWSQSANPSDSYQSFWKYLEIIFSYAGTLSLDKELISVPIEDLQIGDVFIQGGSPGHAVIVVDLVQHKTSGEKIFLLAQSYMPAQEIQVLKNPNTDELGPWYSEAIGEVLRTPEWTFNKGDLKRFDAN